MRTLKQNEYGTFVTFTMMSFLLSDRQGSEIMENGRVGTLTKMQFVRVLAGIILCLCFFFCIFLR